MSIIVCPVASRQRDAPSAAATSSQQAVTACLVACMSTSMHTSATSANRVPVQNAISANNFVRLVSVMLRVRAAPIALNTLITQWSRNGKIELRPLIYNNILCLCVIDRNSLFQNHLGIYVCGKNVQ